MIEMKMNQQHPGCREKGKNHLYKIGMFANMNHVTIKTLRYYDDQKLLVPVYVDEENGYRYYEAGQMAQLQQIIALRNMEENGQIIGHILYVKAKLIATDGTEKKILSFGTFTIHPDYQRKGYGRKLLNHSLEAAREMGYDTVAIYGNPENYACYGFKNCKRFNVCIDDNVYPVALMVKELETNVLSGKNWKYIESRAHQMDVVLYLFKFECSTLR